VVTSLYAKPLALHLYLPPHSCHAPGVLSGLIFGNVLRIHQLCSAAFDIKKELKLFFHCLLDRGYQLQKITPLFQQAIGYATAYLNCLALKWLRMKSRKATEGRRQVFLHLPYHPATPPSKVILRLWHNLVGTPQGNLPIGRGTASPSTGLPLRGIALPILPISSPTGNLSIVRG
jgi:hypothetical protein